MNILFSNYDRTSAKRGPAAGGLALKDLCSSLDLIGHARLWQEDEARDSAEFYRRIETIASQNPIDIAFGGDHLVTFPLFRAVKTRFPDLKLVVFDAHHDAYAYPLATHYSHFFHLVRETGVPIFFIGARFELEKCAIPLRNLSVNEFRADGPERLRRELMNFLGPTSPFYLSIDLDVLDPEAFAGVSAPVKGGLSSAELLAAVDVVQERPPVALDVVEYNPLINNESVFLSALLKGLFKGPRLGG